MANKGVAGAGADCGGGLEENNDCCGVVAPKPVGLLFVVPNNPPLVELFVFCAGA